MSNSEDTFSSLNGKVSSQAEDVNDLKVINSVHIAVTNGVSNVVIRHQGNYPLEKNKFSLLEDAVIDIPSGG